MIKVHKYQIGDVHRLNYHEKEYDAGAQEIEALRPNVLCYTIKRDDRVIAIMGLKQLFPSVFEVWSLASKEATQSYKAVKIAKKFVNEIVEKFSARRVQMTTRLDLECGQRWAEFLGFTKEGVMRKFGPDGADHVLYARVS